jgi:hypothetical protein
MLPGKPRDPGGSYTLWPFLTHPNFSLKQAQTPSAMNTVGLPPGNGEGDRDRCPPKIPCLIPSGLGFSLFRFQCSPEIPVPKYSTKASKANSVWGQEGEWDVNSWGAEGPTSLTEAKHGEAARSFLELNSISGNLSHTHSLPNSQALFSACF